MSQKISFTRNYSDLSTQRGFQFEFNCDRCGTGYRTHFKPFTLGTVAGALTRPEGSAASLQDGRGSRTRAFAAWEKAHDAAS